MAVTGNNKFTAFSRQVGNRNFLSPAGFKFNLAKTPKVDFFSQSVSIPNINLGVSMQTSYLKDIPVPGDKMDYGDLDIEFFIDENLENYLQIERWMRSLGYPETLGEVLKVIEKLASDGMTMLVVTHEIHFAKKISSRIMMLDEGIIVDESNTEVFFNSKENLRKVSFLNQEYY